MKQTFKIRFLLLFALLLLQPSILLFGQSPEDATQIADIPTTPTMAEFQKYGDYPVSLHTGVPEISIPLFSVKSGAISLPISLSYHASGIKVNDKASWVGLGWSLMAGGSITRSIRGGKDEGQHGFINRDFPELGTFNPGISNNWYETEEMIIGAKDSEPDDFYYSFMGYSGRFIFEPGTGMAAPVIALIPHNDLKIVGNFESFTITTPEGYVGEFGDAESSSESRQGIFTEVITAPTAWHLKKITAPNKIDEITFEYKELGDFLDPSYSESQTFTFEDPCQVTQTPSPPVNRRINRGLFYFGVKRLEKISFNNGYILFNSSGNRLDNLQNVDVRLDEVAMYSSLNGVTEKIKSYNLQYGYFGGINPNNDTPDSYEVRLRLDRITEIGTDGSFKNPYKFSYTENIASMGNVGMPHRFSASQDFFGYFNGANGNTSLVPRHRIVYDDSFDNGFIIVGDANREVNPIYAQMGTINKITYPTLGYTVFKFESNTTTIVPIFGTPEQHIAGGLRIANIKNYDFDDTVQWEKSYKYTTPDNPNESSGVYNAKSGEFVKAEDFIRTKELHFTPSGDEAVGSCGPPGGIGPNLIIKSIVGTGTPAFTRNFATVFYATVKEYNGSAADHDGYKWYHYDTTKDHVITSPIFLTTDRRWDRGQLRLEETYTNNQSEPIETVSYDYEKITVRPPVEGLRPEKRFDTKVYGYVPPTFQRTAWLENTYALGYYDQPVVWKRLQFKTTLRDGVTTQEEYSYAPVNLALEPSVEHINLKGVVYTDSEGNRMETKSYYPDDIVSENILEGGVLTGESYEAIAKLKKTGPNFRTGQLIQSVSTQDGETQIQRTNFKDWGANIILPDSRETLKGLVSSTNELESRVTYKKYGNRGNIQEISLENGPITSYIWGYNQQYPIAKIENATYLQIAAALGIGANELESYNETDISDINGLRASMGNALITTYTYELLVGVKSITDARGYKMTFKYDEFNRLKEVIDDKGNLVTDYKYGYAIEQ